MSRYTNDIDTISEMINNSIGSLISSALTFCRHYGYDAVPQLALDADYRCRFWW